VIDQKALSVQVYDILKEQIISDQLKPGDRLSLEQLTQEFGVSRSPVKVALDQLQMEGLVAVAKNRGTFVNTLSDRDVLEMLGIREMIEQYAAEQMRLPADPHVIRELQRLMDEEANLVPGLDKEAFIRWNEINGLFHECLVQASENHQLTKMYKKLNIRLVILRSYRVRPLRPADEVHAEHMALVRAVAETDRAALSTALGRHTSHAREAFQRLRTQPASGERTGP
jgi:DNA-binding GntR family transcriptional regulator